MNVWLKRSIICYLFKRAELFRNVIVVSKSDDRNNIKAELLAELGKELGGNQIGNVSIGDKAEGFRKPLPFTESHAHGKNTGTDTMVSET